MDRIYLELIQKDSLLAQSQISHFKELKYIELIDNTKKDINSLKTYINSIEEDNDDLLTISKIQEHKIKRNRKIGLVMVGIIVLQALL
jgi:predicted transcriptional regulator